MLRIRVVAQLLRAEWSLDMRKPAVLAAAALQLVTMAMLSFLSQPDIHGKTWNSLFWITLLFCTLQAISKNFLGLSKGRWIYWNQLAYPAELLWSKMAYAWISMLAFGLLNFLAFGALMGMPIQHLGLYAWLIMGVAGGIASIFTWIGALATKANQSAFLAPVLSLPLLMPLLLVGMGASAKCLNPILVSSAYKDLALIGSLDFLILVMAGVLFPYLWKD
jgi:heme exporter protein B